MARATGISGVFLNVADPEALAKWYAQHLGIQFHAAGVAVDETFKRKRTGPSAGKVHHFESSLSMFAYISSALELHHNLGSRVAPRPREVAGPRRPIPSFR